MPPSDDATLTPESCKRVEWTTKELSRQYHAREISQQEMKTQLHALRLCDEWGRWWMLGAQTQQWFVYNNGQWMRANPYNPPIPTTIRPLSKFSQNLVDALVAYEEHVGMRVVNRQEPPPSAQQPSNAGHNEPPQTRIDVGCNVGAGSAVGGGQVNAEKIAGRDIINMTNIKLVIIIFLGISFIVGIYAIVEINTQNKNHELILQTQQQNYELAQQNFTLGLVLASISLAALLFAIALILAVRQWRKSIKRSEDGLRDSTTT